MSKKLIILDIKKKVLISDFHKKMSLFDISKYDIVTLTPYSVYLCEKYNYEYKTFHCIESVSDFRDNVLFGINYFSKQLRGIYRILMLDIIPIISLLEYEKNLVNICSTYNKEDILLLTDINNEPKLSQRNISIFLNSIGIHRVVYFKIDVLPSCSTFSRNKNLLHLLKKIFIKFIRLDVRYDWIYYLSFIFKNNRIKSKVLKSIDFMDKSEINKIISENIRNTLLQKKIMKNLGYVDSINMKSSNSVNYATWATSVKKIIDDYNKFSIYYQHGNYFYGNMIFKYSEITPADINFVFNDYTKKLFEELGSKKCYSVGSILFNQPIKERKKEYDFVYITQGHDYTGNFQYVDFPNSTHSFDGYDLYQRHKNIIKLFGEELNEKKIIIKVHPCVVTSGVYVPFWELSEKHPNITIDVSGSVHAAIEKSEYIISDYFTTEFINRELHYKRDIILFKGSPTPLPNETVKDMEKMFILVDTVDELEVKIKNIEDISKNRVRYDDIIEYYSSKKCNTKKVVQAILKEELQKQSK